ncbi:MFS transporter [Novosphingobium umbonatum]|uniref:MFS transporter n=1 Tax=Novosphingobium umbonatum TaxID=1908524 RepID=A0A3S2VU40_9SPHN|nr:MFS transporter [Novosphingobium umbonatum]RVU05842.1 MFS transporter [Novosphingobium umbonatum]
MSGQLRLSPYLPFAALLLANFMEVLNHMFVNISMPVVSRQLHASDTITHWVFSSYALGFALTLVLTGSMADRIGHRRIFLTGAALFVLASLACAMSDQITPFLLARVAQGAAFAMTAPQVMGLLHILYTPEQRVKLLPALGFASASAGTFGPVAAGFLITANWMDMGWRTVFLGSACIGLVSFLLGFWLLPRHTQGQTGTAMPKGRWGLALVVALIMALFEWLGRGEQGFQPWMLAALALPVIAVLLLRKWQREQRETEGQAIDPDAKRQLVTGAMLTICFSASSNSLLIIVNHIMQTTLGRSPSLSGAMLIPYGLGVFFSILCFGRYLLKPNGRFVLATGASLLMIAAPLIIWASAQTQLPLWALLPILGLAGVGVGMTSGCIGPASLARMPTAYAGTGAATLRLGQQIGLAFGGAMIMRPYFHAAQLHDTMPSLPPHLMTMLLVLATAVTLALHFPKPLFPRHRQG